MSHLHPLFLNIMGLIWDMWGTGNETLIYGTVNSHFYKLFGIQLFLDALDEILKDTISRSWKLEWPKFNV